LSEDGKIFLYRAKTGVAVNVPVPPDVAESLHALPSENARYFFWSGNGDPQTACKVVHSVHVAGALCRRPFRMLCARIERQSCKKTAQYKIAATNHEIISLFD